MTKIQIIIDYEESLKALTCTGVMAETLTPGPEEIYTYGYERIPKSFHFDCTNVIADDSPNLISIPDELLLRIRDYNIDAEHEYTMEQTRKLKQKNDNLQQSIGHNLVELNALEKEVERFYEVLRGMIDRYPMAAAEICLQDGDLDAACYFVKKANEEEEENDGNN